MADPTGPSSPRGDHGDGDSRRPGTPGTRPEALAEAVADLGISASQVWRILSDLDLKPWQSRFWLTSHDPDFWRRTADVCDLYLNPPENALVLSVDEKTGMQAKTPTNPTKKARLGLVERREFEYRRNGTAALFAALDVHSGEVIWEAKQRNRSVELISFLEHVDQVTPPDLTIHLIRDNGASHVSKQTQAWIENRAARFEVHHTPTHASWLNQSNCSSPSWGDGSYDAADSSQSTTSSPRSAPSSPNTTGKPNPSDGPTKATPQTRLMRKRTHARDH